MLLNYKAKGSDWQILGFQMSAKILNKLILNISAILYLKLTIKKCNVCHNRKDKMLRPLT